MLEELEKSGLFDKLEEMQTNVKTHDSVKDKATLLIKTYCGYEETVITEVCKPAIPANKLEQEVRNPDETAESLLKI